MFHIEETFLELINSIESSRPLTLDSEGFWRDNSGFLSKISNKLFPSRQIIAITRTCIENFKRIERVPVNRSEYADVDHMSYNIIAQYLEKKLRQIPGARKSLRELMRHRVGFQHRFGGRHGGESRLLMGYIECRLLNELASRWKKNQPTFRLNFLTNHDYKRLKQAAQYPLFVDLLVEFPSLQEKFFRWVLQSNNPVDVFIEFPGIADWVIESDLSNRLGRVGDLLRLDNLNGEKHVTLMFEGQRVSILDPKKKITFKGGYNLAIDEIFDVFAQKYYEVGNLEVFNDGITNWNTFQLGHWDVSLQDYVTIDVIQDRWWELLPRFERITKKDAEERYGIDLPPDQWVVSAHATRGLINLSYEQTHAFVQVAVPTGNNTYDIYDFGKYGLFFPKNYLDVMKLFTKTMPAAVMYPDENAYYLQRQHGYYPIIMTPDQGLAIMGKIRKEIMKSFAGQRVYQIETENCARWTHELFASVLGESHLPNLYRMQLIDCEPGGPVQVLFTMIKLLPSCFHSRVITRLHYLLGAWRGIWIKKSSGHVWRSVSNHEFFDTGEVYLPALVIHKSLEGLFLIQKADLMNRTTWWLICQKMFCQATLISSRVGVAIGEYLHSLHVYIKNKVLIRISLDRDK